MWWRMRKARGRIRSAVVRFVFGELRLAVFADAEARASPESDLAPEGGPRFDDVNPATGEVICEVAAADAGLLDEAVAAAKAAQRQWIALPAAERGRVLDARRRASCASASRSSRGWKCSTPESRSRKRRRRISARPRIASSFSPG